MVAKTFPLRPVWELIAFGPGHRRGRIVGIVTILSAIGGGVVAYAGHNVVGRAHSEKRIVLQVETFAIHGPPENHRHGVAGQREPHRINIRGSPDIAVAQAPGEGRLAGPGSDEPPSALMIVMTMMAEPGVGQHRPAKSAGP